MVKRLKQLVVIMMASLLVLLQLPGVEVLAATTIRTDVGSDDVLIDTDSDTGYEIYGSGGAITVTLADGCTINGDVNIGGTAYPTTTCNFNLGNGSVIKGSIIVISSTGNAVITFNNSIVEGAVNNSGGTLSGSGKIGTLYLDGGNVSFTGNTEIGTLTLESGALSLASGTLTITDSIEINGTNQATPLFTVNQDTTIRTASAVTVSYNGSAYNIAAGTNGTLNDVAGNTIKVANAVYSHITNTTGDADGEAKYLKGDTVTFTYEAEDGYYFPENYGSDSDAFTVDSGYAGSLTVTRKSYSEIEVQYTISDETGKEIKINLPAASVRQEGTGTVTVADVNYGGTVNPVITSATNDVDSAVVQYKKQGAADTEYSDEVPAAVGDYTVRVKFREKDGYNGFEATDDFSIQYLPAPAAPYTIAGTKGENGYYSSKVRILPPEGYSIAENLDGEYGAYLEYSASTGNRNIYLKKNSTGEKTNAIALEPLRIDTIAPSVSAVNGKVYYGDSIEITVQDNHLKTVTVNGEPVETDGNVKNLTLTSDSGISVYEIVTTDQAGNSTTVTVTVAAEWTQTGNIPSGLAVRLEAGQPYKFDSGTWKVSGDDTCYTGNSTFYIKEGGTYTFMQQ